MDDLFQAMDEFVAQQYIFDLIEEACKECEADIKYRGAGETFRVVIPTIDTSGVASELRSLWVFAFAPNAKSDIHKHSNSTQYTRNWRGKGHLNVGSPENAIELHLSQQIEELISDNQWISIPSGTFHEAIGSEDVWCVISFQTVPAEELQCEQFSGTSHNYVS